MNTPAIGHNQPPTPFDDISKEVADIYDEAKLWLDGEEVTAEQEQSVEKLLTMIKDISKRERALFTETKKPHKEAGEAVDKAHNPLKKRLEDAKQAAQAALTPLRTAREVERQEAQRKAHAEAEQKQREAQALAASTSNADLGAREIVDNLEQQAKDAAKKATGISRQATGLRKTYVPYLTDSSVAATHYFKTRHSDFEEFLSGLAKTDVRAGCRKIPGFEIKQENLAQ